LERAAVGAICASEQVVDLSELQAIWMVPPEARISDGKKLAMMDEAFQQALSRPRVTPRWRGSIMR
jgi:hypothetical protein